MQRSCDRLVEEMLKKEQLSGQKNKRAMSDDYEDEEFENQYEQENDFEEDEEDYKLVDEEISMNTSVGKRDAQILKDIISKTEKRDQKASSQQHESEPDEIDEFIKRHMIDDKEERKEEEDEDDEYYAEECQRRQQEEREKAAEKRDPKEVLIAELKRLGDIFGQYSLTDRQINLDVKIHIQGSFLVRLRQYFKNFNL